MAAPCHPSQTLARSRPYGPGTMPRQPVRDSQAGAANAGQANSMAELGNRLPAAVPVDSALADSARISIGGACYRRGQNDCGQTQG